MPAPRFDLARYEASICGCGASMRPKGFTGCCTRTATLTFTCQGCGEESIVDYERRSGRPLWKLVGDDAKKI